MLVTSAVFVIIPSLTAFIATRLIVNDDAWTHDEQEQVKDDLKQILTTLKTNVTYTTNKSIHKG
jgi:voltage-gated potassium channel